LQPGQQQNPKPAPGPLVVVQDFVNTLNLERGTEELGNAEQARAWLVGRRLLHESANVTDGDFRRLIELRERLREILAAHNLGSRPDEQGAEAAKALNQLARSTTLRVAFEHNGEAKLVPNSARSQGVNRAIATMLAIIFHATVEGTWRRLKACRSEGCRWVFYDNSKNRSGTWCVMEVCGSRAKMRSYRRRSAAKPS